MNREEHNVQPHCCPCGNDHGETSGVSRRGFLGGLGGAAIGGAALTGLSWSMVSAGENELESPPPRRPLVVKPVLSYETPKRKEQSSWRPWGGIETLEQAEAEVGRIETELAALAKRADFPVKILPVTKVNGRVETPALGDAADADVVLMYAAGGPSSVFEPYRKAGKDMIFFVRWKSGPVYLWYEIVSPRYLRSHGDELKIKGLDDRDVVVDSQDEVLWRLRSLCGLRNTVGTKVLCIGGAAAWAQPKGVVEGLVKETFGFDLPTVSYEELGKLIKEARADEKAVALAKRRAAAYLALPETKLETKREFVENALLLDQVFRGLMKQADCRAITVNNCMGTIMPKAETSACMTLSTLNDDGYLAFCESDFVVIPAGVLLANIAGKPMFLNDPTYPHDGIITLAHCTAPRKLDGKRLEPARILTHFESDYGASPKVEMRKGQTVTNIIPDFGVKRYVGLLGEIVDAPFMPICRSQIDVKFKCDSLKLAQRMPGFHWMTIYGDYMREAGYALKRLGIDWEVLA